MLVNKTAEPLAARAGATPNLRWAFMLVTSLFFMWGLSYGLLDVLNKHFQETLHVTKAQSGLLQAAYFGAYFWWRCPPATLWINAVIKRGSGRLVPVCAWRAAVCAGGERE